MIYRCAICLRELDSWNVVNERMKQHRENEDIWIFHLQGSSVKSFEGIEIDLYKHPYMKITDIYESDD